MKVITETKSGVSLCMIVKDEAELIEDCLKSVKELADEIIVADTGSADGTAEICRRYGATVFSCPWEDSFSEARNRSIEKASCEWILLLDADERIFHEDREKFLQFVRTSRADGAHFKVYNYLGKEGRTQYTLHNALRLVRNNGLYRFAGDIHEQIVRTDGKPVENLFAVTDIRLHHLGYLDDVVIRKNKRGRNIPILMKELQKDPENAFTLFNLGNEYMAQKEYRRALELYAKAKARYNRQEAYGPHLLFRIAMCRYTLGEYAGTVETLSEGLSVYPGCTDMELLKGFAYMAWGRDLLALESFQKAVAMGEPSAALRFSDGCATTRPFSAMALIYERQYDYANAAACYVKAVHMDNKLYSALYGVARMLKKMKTHPAEIEQRLSGFFADINYPPNRILLADILLSERIGPACDKHLRFLETMEGYEAEKAMLWGKCLFHGKKYEQAKEALAKALHGKEVQKVFAGLKKDAALLLFAAMLITGSGPADDAEGAVRAVGENFGRPGELVCRQVQNVLSGKEESLLAGENPEELTDFFAGLLKLVLESGAFDLFERLLYVYNHIESPRVLLSLAHLYLECGFPELAASAVLRSVKELDRIDAPGARILADALFLKGPAGNRE